MVTNKKEELLKRALNTTNFADSIHEDLSDLITMVTPKDVPMWSRLARTVATALNHEWTETTLDSAFTSAAYSDGGTPAANTNTTVRKGNQVMQLGRRAQATELLERLNTVGKRSQGMSAFDREVEDKMQNLMRAIEYFIWNGNKANTAPQEMDGILRFMVSAQQVANGGAVLSELKLQEAITKCYDAGGNPTVIAANPTVCQRITNFTADKIRYLPGGGVGGTGVQGMRYVSPLGYDLEVVPVRAEFLPTGQVLVLTMDQLALAEVTNSIEFKDLAVSNDSVADLLIKWYGTLEFRVPQHSALISGVANTLS